MWGQIEGRKRFSEGGKLTEESIASHLDLLKKPAHPCDMSQKRLALRLYYQQGENDRAEQLYRRSLAIREKALGSDHPDVAMSLDNLAKLYQAQGKYAEAEPLLQRSLAIRKGATKRLGAKPPDRPRIPRIFPGGRPRN